MMLYLLDTNAVSMALRRQPQLLARLEVLAAEQIALSVITEAELLYGLARRPEAHRLSRLVHGFLKNTEILPWTSEAARYYAEAKAELDRRGQPLGIADMMIAAHALAEDAVLVTNDAAFARIDGLKTEDWTR
jgi:tRNA(fMet)-specific endonuclease VapC